MTAMEMPPSNRDYDGEISGAIKSGERISRILLVDHEPSLRS